MMVVERGDVKVTPLTGFVISTQPCTELEALLRAQNVARFASIKRAFLPMLRAAEEFPQRRFCELISLGRGFWGLGMVILSIGAGVVVGWGVDQR